MRYAQVNSFWKVENESRDDCLMKFMIIFFRRWIISVDEIGNVLCIVCIKFCEVGSEISSVFNCLEIINGLNLILDVHVIFVWD